MLSNDTINLILKQQQDFCARINDILMRPIMAHFLALFEASVTKTEQKSKILLTFQTSLKAIMSWSQERAADEYARIMANHASEKTFPKILSATFQNEVQIHLIRQVGVQNSHNIMLNVPGASAFVHKCLVESANLLYKNAELFLPIMDTKTIRSNRNKIEGFIKTGILAALRKSLPIDLILQEIEQAQRLELTANKLKNMKGGSESGSSEGEDSGSGGSEGEDSDDGDDGDESSEGDGGSEGGSEGDESGSDNENTVDGTEITGGGMNEDGYESDSALVNDVIAAPNEDIYNNFTNEVATHDTIEGGGILPPEIPVSLVIEPLMSGGVPLTFQPTQELSQEQLVQPQPVQIVPMPMAPPSSQTSGGNETMVLHINQPDAIQSGGSRKSKRGFF